MKYKNLFLEFLEKNSFRNSKEKKFFNFNNKKDFKIKANSKEYLCIDYWRSFNSFDSYFWIALKNIKTGNIEGWVFKTIFMNKKIKECKNKILLYVFNFLVCKYKKDKNRLFLVDIRKKIPKK